MTAVSLAYFWSFYDYKTGRISSHIKTPKQRRANKQIVHTGMWHRYQRREHLPGISYILFLAMPGFSMVGTQSIVCAPWKWQCLEFSAVAAIAVTVASKMLLSLQKHSGTVVQMHGRTDGQIYIWNVLLYFASARFLSFWFWYHRWCCWCWYCNGSWLLLLAMVLSHYRMLFLLL